MSGSTNLSPRTGYTVSRINSSLRLTALGWIRISLLERHQVLS